MTATINRSNVALYWGVEAQFMQGSGFLFGHFFLVNLFLQFFDFFFHSGYYFDAFAVSC